MESGNNSFKTLLGDDGYSLMFRLAFLSNTSNEYIYKILVENKINIKDLYYFYMACARFPFKQEYEVIKMFGVHRLVDFYQKTI